MRESEYYLDPVAAMAGLWDVLCAAGITPEAGDLGAAPASDGNWTPVELEPGTEEVVTEVAVPGASSRPAGAQSADAAWDGWLADASETPPESDTTEPGAGDAGEANSELWTMPPSDGASTIVSKELPRNGFHDGGIGRSR